MNTEGLESQEAQQHRSVKAYLSFSGLSGLDQSGAPPQHEHSISEAFRSLQYPPRSKTMGRKTIRIRRQDKDSRCLIGLDDIGLGVATRKVS